MFTRRKEKQIKLARKIFLPSVNNRLLAHHVEIGEDRQGVAVGDVHGHDLIAIGLIRDEHQTLALGHINASLEGMENKKAEVTVGHYRARLAVDVVPQDALRLLAGYEVDALLSGHVHAAVVGPIDYFTAAGAHVMLVGDNATGLALDKVPLGTSRLRVRHKVDASARRRVDTAMVGAALGHRRHVLLVPVGVDARRLGVHVVPVGSARLRVRHEVDAHRVRTVDATAVGAE